MFSELKKLAKHSGIYSLGNLSGHFLSFLLLPIYTRFLTPEQYGILAIITVFRTIYEKVINLGTQSSLVKTYFEVNSEDKRKVVISTAFLFVLGVSVTVTAACWLFREQFSVFFLNDQKFVHLFSLALLASLFFTIKTIPLATFRAREKSVVYSIFAFLTLVLGLTFNVIFVVVFREGVKGILKGTLLSQSITFLLILIPFAKNLVARLSKDYLLRMLSFGLPIVPSGLAIWVLTLLDRYFLRVFTTMEIVGIYSLGYKISAIMSMLMIVPFSMAWSPLMFKWYKEENAELIYARVYKYFSVFGFLVVLGLSLFSKEVIQIMTTPAFYDAYKIVFFIASAYLLHGFYMIFTAGCSFYRKTFYFPIATGVAALANTILNILLIPRYQMMGAAIATVSSYFIMTAMMYVFSERYYHIPFDFLTTAKIALITSGLYVLGLFTGNSLLFSSLTKVLLVMAYFPCLYIVRIFTQSEMRVIKSRILRGKVK